MCSVAARAFCLSATLALVLALGTGCGGGVAASKGGSDAGWASIDVGHATNVCLGYPGLGAGGPSYGDAASCRCAVQLFQKLHPGKDGGDWFTHNAGLWLGPGQYSDEADFQAANHACGTHFD
jgi:hypothetical protein